MTEKLATLRHQGRLTRATMIEYTSYAFVVLVAALLRFVNLGNPKALVFDETYYVKDAYSYLLSGVERNWTQTPNPNFINGNPDGILNTGEYIVHPPVGKWVIAMGMKIFGQDSTFGWRFGVAVTGTLTVVLMIAVAKKLFNSPLLAATAGLLLAIDGVHLTLSRTSILDGVLCFWILLAFYFILIDRDKVRIEMALHRASNKTSSMNLWRPWRLASGVALGLALGTKWSALYFIALWGIMIVWWDFKAGRKNMLHAPLTFLYLVPVSIITYIATWTGWIQSSVGYDRNWAQQNPTQTVSWIPDWLQSLWAYHESAYNFHTHLENTHPYKSPAILWLLQMRPTAFYYEGRTNGQDGCTVDKCSTAVSNLGNPLIWWFATASLLVLIYFWITRKDWKAAAILSGVAAGWLPWFLYPKRTTYEFYSVAFEPFMILALVYVAGLILGQKKDSKVRRRDGFIVFILGLTIIVLVSAYFYPIWTAEVIPYDSWRARMWFDMWI